MDFYTQQEMDQVLMNNLSLKMAFAKRTHDNREIDTIECKWTTRVTKQYANDMHIVREKIFYKDGGTSINMRLVKDFRREYYVTKPIYQTYKQKKDMESLDKLNVRFSTEKYLAKNINISLGVKYPSNSFGRSNKITSPYIYGASIPSTTMLKLLYDEYFNYKFSEYHVLNCDIEAHPETEVIYIISISDDDVLYSFTTKEYTNGIDGVVEKVLSKFEDYVPDFDRKHIIKRHVFVLETEADIITEAFKTAHMINPDILAIWNMEYDLKVIERRATLYNLKMEDLLHSPLLPEECKFYEWREGFRFIGDKPISPEKIWHVALSSAGFKLVDAMRVYLYTRNGEKEMPGGVGLNAVLDANGIHRKLEMPGTEEYEGLEGKKWHMAVAKKEPVFYIIYNQYDIIAMGRLDRKTNDLRVTFPASLEGNDFEVFNSNPTQLMFVLYKHVKKHARSILCS